MAARGAVAVLLAIELLDELVWGSRSAAWPLVRHDLGLGYAEIGLLVALPALLGSLLDPLIGVLGDTRHRRALIVAGGIGFAAAGVLNAAALQFAPLLAALLLANPSSGAFVSLAQATLMDREPAGRERNMARWTVAGSVGYVAGPVLIAAGIAAGIGWRGVVLLLSLPAVPLALAVRPARAEAERPDWRGFVAALRDREVLRWLAILEASDLMLDVFHGFLALYAVAAVDASPVEAALAVAVWTGAGFAGDVLLLVVLRRMQGVTWVRATAAVALVAYPAFLLVPSTTAKLALLALLGLLGSGWYAIPKARLYETLPGRSGTAVAVGGMAGIVGAAAPATVGAVAAAAGLVPAMWLLLLGPLALVIGLRSRA